MKHTVPTLTALAAFAVIGTPAFGASIADDLVIKPKTQIQVRAQFGAAGTTTTGADYNPFNGAVGDTETARFSVRRARFGAEAKNTTGWSAVFQIRAGERADAVAGGIAPAAAKARAAELYYANVTKVFKADGYEIDIHGGLDKPFNAESSISSSGYLMAMDRPNAHWTEVRDVGIGSKGLFAEIVRAGFDIQNNQGANNQDANSDANGLFTSFRVEFAPGKQYMPSKKLESWAGQEGQHIVIGFDYQNDADRLTTVGANDQKTSVQTIGPDVLVHFDGLTALADLRMRTTKVENQTGASPADVKGQVYTVQAGYAFPFEQGFAIEPALRISKIDLNKDVDGDNSGTIDQGEYRTNRSGNELTFGVNAYWNGHANKTQLSYTSFTGEEGNAGTEKMKAHIITLQQQVTF